MGLVTTKDMFQKAYEGGYAIGAFNVNNMEIVQGITEAAGELKSPVILQVSKGARAYANHTYLVKLVEAALIENDIPMALHLDHGPDFATCKACIDGGFTSVMIDGSQYDFEKNVEITRQVVEYAHEKGVVVEGELGKLAGVEDDVKVDASDAMYTHPDEVQEFVERTLIPRMSLDMAREPENPKSALQEKLQEDGITPTYKLVETQGPPHDRTFVAQVFAGTQGLARGTGRTKKEAESQAAKSPLARLGEFFGLGVDEETRAEKAEAAKPAARAEEKARKKSERAQAKQRKQG